MPRTIVITGASDGIGAAAARKLTARGEHVVIVGRSPEKTAALAAEIGAPFHVADFTRLAEVRALAGELQAYDRIDVLVNNAGGILGERELTEDGHERTFQLNHLAGFLLTSLLLEKLIASNAKVIQTASDAANAWGKRFDIDDLENSRDYSPTRAYGHGKLENVLFTRELDRRTRQQGIAAVAFHPGVVRSNFASETSFVLRFLYHSPLKYLFTISSERSAERLLALIDGEPGRDWQQGETYNGSKPMRVRFQDPDGSVARSLWDQSVAMLS